MPFLTHKASGIVTDGTPIPDAWGIMANHRSGDKICRSTSQCWIMWTNPGGGFDRNMMVVRSRSGRWVRKWMRADRMENWRIKWVPPELREIAMCLSTKEEANKKLERMHLPLPDDPVATHAEIGALAGSQEPTKLRSKKREYNRRSKLEQSL